MPSAATAVWGGQHVREGAAAFFPSPEAAAGIAARQARCQTRPVQATRRQRRPQPGGTAQQARSKTRPATAATRRQRRPQPRGAARPARSQTRPAAKTRRRRWQRPEESARPARSRPRPAEATRRQLRPRQLGSARPTRPAAATHSQRWWGQRAKQGAGPAQRQQ
jgi:hypothetical protein